MINLDSLLVVFVNHLDCWHNVKYQIGDLVQLSNLWDNQLGLIIDLEEDTLYGVYYIIIPSEPTPGWLAENVIVSKVF